MEIFMNALPIILLCVGSIFGFIGIFILKIAVNAEKLNKILPNVTHTTKVNILKNM